MIMPVFQSRFGRVKWRDLDAPGPIYEYLIDGWISAGDKSIIGGPSRSGKSFLGIHASMCIARGTPFFGNAVKQGLVVYQAGEGARGVRRKRLPAYRKHFNIPDDEDVPFELLTSEVDLYRADGDTRPLIDEINAIKAEYPDLPLAATVIDTLATATGGADENSGKDMGTVMKNIALIQKETGAAVILIHHLNSSGTKLRGHTSIYANVDQVIMVTRDEVTKIRTARLDKMKDDEDGVTLKFELMSVHLGERPDGKPISSCVCVPVGSKEHIKADMLRRGWSPNPTERRVLTAMFEALKRHGRLAGPSLEESHKIKPLTEVIEWSEYRDVARSLAMDDGVEERSADAIRKEFERARDALFNAGVIGVAKPYLWWAGRPVKGFQHTFPKADEGRTNGGQAADKALSEFDGDDFKW
ncbi:helicase RepA family protein [Boseaceae bacterium BT-24-1]|nr:helicase RepA family protein [Boseaceae bacterium BT-24-1]